MMSWRASAPANTAGVWNGRPASESTTRNHRATVSPASRPPTAPCPIRSLMAGLIVPSARTTRTQYHAGPRARNRRRRGLWRSLRDFPFWYLMTGDATTPELPPGLLEDYLEGMRGQLGALARVADHLDADGGDQEALEQLRRETHKIHGSAGSFGFWSASRLAAGMEETAKDWLSRPTDTDVDRGSLTRWFVVRLAEILRLDVPTTQRADRPSGPILQADLLNVPEVIVVEDDPALAELLEYGLRSRAYRFACYRDGGEALGDLLALETGESHPLLLLDVDLPVVDGYAIFEALERERPGAYRVVFTTARGDESEQRRGLEAGALEY